MIAMIAGLVHLPSAKNRQAIEQQRHDREADPGNVGVDAEQAEIPDRPGEGEMGAERVDLQILVELKVEIDCQPEPEIEAHGAQRFGRMPVEEEPVDPRPARFGGTIQRLPFRAGLGIGTSWLPFCSMPPRSVMIATRCSIVGFDRSPLVDRIPVEGREIERRFEPDDPLRIVRPVAEGPVHAVEKLHMVAAVEPGIGADQRFIPPAVERRSARARSRSSCGGPLLNAR